MIVEQTQSAQNEQEAEDILEGWRRLPNFALGYMRKIAQRKEFTLVGLFHVSDGRIGRGQREVEVKLGWEIH